MKSFDKQRVALLLEDLDQELEFAAPQNIQQVDALEAFNILTPQQRTELLTDMFLFWHTWHTQFAIME